MNVLIVQGSAAWFHHDMKKKNISFPTMSNSPHFHYIRNLQRCNPNQKQNLKHFNICLKNPDSQNWKDFDLNLENAEKKYANCNVQWYKV